MEIPRGEVDAGSAGSQPHNGEKNLHGELPPGECHSSCMVPVLSSAELCESGDTMPHHRGRGTLSLPEKMKARVLSDYVSQPGLSWGIQDTARPSHHIYS